MSFLSFSAPHRKKVANLSLLACSMCKIAFYCLQQFQKAHWPSHTNRCNCISDWMMQINKDAKDASR
ncbi:zinc finger MYND domain-containing protein [archaeon]|nr:MAG: zinc finger MYND domain-containing protein [archaeon]